MIVFDFNKPYKFIQNNKPCIRIRINNPKDRVEYKSVIEAANDIVNTSTNVRICCERNKGLVSPKFRVKDWYFIYKS